MNLCNITIPREEIDNGLYEVTIEKTVLHFDAWNDDWILHNNIETEYVVVTNYKSFENWLSNKNKEEFVKEIRFKKIAENVLLIR